MESYDELIHTANRNKRRVDSVRNTAKGKMEDKKGSDLLSTGLILFMLIISISLFITQNGMLDNNETYQTVMAKVSDGISNFSIDKIIEDMTFYLK